MDGLREHGLCAEEYAVVLSVGVAAVKAARAFSASVVASQAEP